MLNPTEEYKQKQRKFSMYQAKARKNPTPSESLVKDSLDRLGIKYVFQKGFLRWKTLRLVDFYLPFPAMVCLEVDGGYHEQQADYDRYREGQIKNQRVGILTFVRITNEWVMSQKNLDEALKKLLPDPYSQNVAVSTNQSTGEQK